MTLEGYPVLDAGGAPIQLDPQNGPPDGRRGRLAAPERPAGRRARPVQLRSRHRISSATAIPASSRPASRSRWSTALDVGVAQGFVEESNVNPVLEMTRLIMVQRAFENIAALMRETESSLDEAIKTLGSK